MKSSNSSWIRRPPIAPEVVRAFVRYCQQLNRTWLAGSPIKKQSEILKKAREMGFGRTKAYEIIKAARREGRL